MTTDQSVRCEQREVVRLLTPAPLCHKDTAQGTQSPSGAFLAFRWIFMAYLDGSQPMRVLHSTPSVFSPSIFIDCDLSQVVEKEDLGWGSSKSRLEDICAPSNSNKPAWEQDLNENISSLAASNKSSNWDNDFDSK